MRPLQSGVANKWDLHMPIWLRTEYYRQCVDLLPIITKYDKFFYAAAEFNRDSLVMNNKRLTILIFNSNEHTTIITLKTTIGFLISAKNLALI